MLSEETRAELAGYASRGRIGTPATITLDALEQTALIGDEVRFSWRIEGSIEAWVEAPQRGEVYPAPPVGSLIVEAGSRPERFRLVAIGLGGIEESVEFRLIPRLPSIMNIPADLDVIHMPWE